MVHQPPIDLLRHARIVAAQPRLDVSYGYGEFGRCKRRCEGGVHISVDDDDPRLALQQHRFDCAQDRRCLGCVTPRAHAQFDIRVRHAQRLPEVAGHRIVVVLTGIDDALRDALLDKRSDDRSRLGHIGSSTDNVEHLAAHQGVDPLVVCHRVVRARVP